MARIVQPSRPYFLRWGMDFLRDESLATGCLANRYLVLFSASSGTFRPMFAMRTWRGRAPVAGSKDRERSFAYNLLFAPEKADDKVDVTYCA
jgi:hypothetical protein